jgi:hypothetical protein
MPVTPLRTIRLYTLLVDDQPATQSFDHSAGMEADDLNQDLARRFHAWLEEIAPGAHAAGRVTGIGFSDFTEVRPAGAPLLKPVDFLFINGQSPRL